MPAIDLSILNQRQTPAFYADVFANRPAAGFVGRIFVSTNTFAFYRDNGTSWDLIGGPGTGTVTGTGANGQVTFWNGASTITGSNDLFWDATNGHLGVNTNVPGTALDVHHDQPTVAIINQTVATNDVRIGFQNNGVGLWRIGAFYNAGANDFGIYDTVAAIQPVTVKKTTGQVLIGTSTVGSGKLVVASTTGDNGIQIVSATAPSLRIDSAESGPTKRAGFGISTATNNFIQGSADRDFCMFNGSTTASPILFGIYDTTNVQEAARISAARNFLIGTTTDGGQKLQVNGGARTTGYYLNGMTSGAGALYWGSTENRVTLANYNANGILNFEVNGGASAMTIDANGQLGLGVLPSAWGNQGKAMQLNAQTLIAGMTFSSVNNQTLVGNNVYVASDTNFKYIANNPAGLYRISNDGSMQWFNAASGTAGNTITFAQAMTLNAIGNLGIGANSPTAKLDVVVSDSATDVYAFSASNATNASLEVYLKSNVTTLNAGGSGTFVFANGNKTERMRLAAGTGNLLIGTTTDAGQKLQVNGTALISGALTTGSPITMIGTTPFIQWVNNSAIRLGYIQHNASNLVYNADTGNHIFNQSIEIANTVTAAVGIASTHKVSILINGVQYYLLASNV